MENIIETEIVLLKDKQKDRSLTRLNKIRNERKLINRNTDDHTGYYEQIGQSRRSG